MKHNFEKELRLLRDVKPNSALHERLHLLTQELPDLRTRSVVPLIVFRLALAGLVLLLFGSAGTGILLAAKGSNPGSILYPIKQVVDTHQVPFFSSPVATPTALPTSAPAHHVISSPKEDEQEHEGHVSSQSAHDAGEESVHQDVKGISTKRGEEGKDHLNPTAVPSLLPQISPVIKHTDDESGN